MSDAPKCEPKLLRDALDYDPASGLLSWKVRQGLRASDNTRHAGQRAGWVCKEGYIRIEFLGKAYRAHRVAWAWMTGAWPDREIDHINGVTGDNRWGNLRLATTSENQRNRAKTRRNSTGYKGVYFDKRRLTWKAAIGINGKYKHLGTFGSPESASAAYAAAAQQLHGVFSRQEPA